MRSGLQGGVQIVAATSPGILPLAVVIPSAAPTALSPAGVLTALVGGCRASPEVCGKLQASMGGLPSLGRQEGRWTRANALLRRGILDVRGRGQRHLLMDEDCFISC